jgi:hypothetical protein
MAVSTICLQTRKRLGDLELKQDKNKHSGNMNEG